MNIIIEFLFGVKIDIFKSNFQFIIKPIPSSQSHLMNQNNRFIKKHKIAQKQKPLS